VTKTASWLSIDNDFGPLPPAGTITVTISLTSEVNSFPEGVYTDTLTFINIIPNEQQYRVVNLTVALPQGMWVSPTSFDVNVFEGGRLTENMQIGNDGIISFDYQIRTRGVAASAAAAEGSISASAVAAERIEKIKAAAK
jgi:hypothetical protein